MKSILKKTAAAGLLLGLGVGVANAQRGSHSGGGGGGGRMPGGGGFHPGGGGHVAPSGGNHVPGGGRVPDHSRVPTTGGGRHSGTSAHAGPARHSRPHVRLPAGKLPTRRPGSSVMTRPFSTESRPGHSRVTLPQGTGTRPGTGGQGAHVRLPTGGGKFGKGPRRPGTGGLSLTDQGALINFLNKDPAVPGIATDVAQGNPLNAAEISFLTSVAKIQPNTAVGQGALEALAADQNHKQSQAIVNALQNLVGGLASQGGMTMDGLTPPDGGCWGFQPGVACASFPCDADDPDGGSMAVACDPGYAPSTDAVADSGSVADAVADASDWQTTRFLRVSNATNEKLTVYVQVKTENEDEDWVWFPSRPGGDEVLGYELQPGATVELKDSDWKVNGSRARIWAVSDKREYAQFKDKDLWLVPETDAEGYHGYSAPDVQTMDLAIR